jgi:dienelactone hydrolase
MTIQTRLIEYRDGDTVLEGYLAWNDSHSGAAPGVIVSHAWGGRDEFVGEKARKLAELGYVGFAMDMYGKGVRGSSVDENSALMQPFMEDRKTLQRRMHLSLDTLRQQPEVDASRIAAMGFCFGGLCVLDLARTGADIRGVASFHGLLFPPDNTKGTRISARVLCMHGYDDPMGTPDAVLALADELTAAEADWQLHAYGNTQHAFTNPMANDSKLGTVYNAAADRRSWHSLVNFLEELFPAA